jgi:biopolymer transport protein ExbD
MRRYASRQAYQTLSELNVTPLIDLAFVLLIIFMITTPLIEANIDLIVPTSQAAEGAIEPTDVQFVAIDRTGIITLNEEPVSPEVLRAELELLRAANPNTAVAIRADRDLTIQILISLMDAIKEAGITKVGLLTRPDEAPAAQNR